MLSMTQAERQEAIENLLALAKVESDGDYAETILRSTGAPSHPVLVELLTRGANSFLKDKRHEDRVRLKVLRLDPEHYVEIDSIAAKMSTPAADREKARDAATQKKRRKQYEAKAWAVVAATNAKVKKASEFYENWFLSNGATIGDASKVVLEMEAAKERSAAAGHEKNAAFYEALAARVPDGKTVREAIDLTDAHRIRESIFRTEI